MKIRIKEFVFKYAELLRYGIVGGVSTLFGLLFFLLLESVLNIHYLIANAITWTVSVILVFFANKYLVFRSKDKDKTATEMSLFFGTRIAASIVDMVLLYVMVDILLFSAFPSKLVTTVIIALLNYVTSKLIVFKKTSKGVSLYE